MKRKNSSFAKKILLYLGIIIGIIVLVVAGIFIYRLIVGNTKSYTELEKMMENSAKNYFQKFDTLLPINIEEEISVSDSQLVEAEFMKPLSKYTKKGVTCTGEVRVRKVNDNSFSYRGYLDCGKDYVTIELFSKLIEDGQKFKNDRSGLYQMDTEYVYRGDNPNNYLKFAGKNWRIVKITEDNKIMIIQIGKTDNVVWDDRYNTEYGNSNGINDYSVSRIRSTLEKMYNDSKYLSANDITKLSPYSLCIGKRSRFDSYEDIGIECSERYDNQYIGLLPLSDYIRASLDENCKGYDSAASCSNYNYFSLYEDAWWTITGNKNASNRVFKIDRSVQNVLASTMGRIRPVLMLNQDVMYKSGTGTQDNPYTIR